MGIMFEIITPFAGTVSRIMFHLGDKVEEGDVLFSLVNNGVNYDILSPISGYFDRIEVDKGDQVLSGMILGCIKESNSRE